MQGYIKLFRKTLGSSIFQDPFYFKLWMYCLMKASHKEHEQIVGNQMVTLQPGQFVIGRQALTEEMNRGMKPKQKQSELTWWRYLNNLEKWEMLNIKKTNKYSVITVSNWCNYQENEQEMNNKRTSDEQQLNTNKNVKNGKNEKKERQKFKYESSDMELAEKLLRLIEDNGEKLSPNYNLEKWANEFRLMRERDERTHEQIDYLIEWSQNHHFWKKNILSGDKIRKHYDQMVRQVKEEKGQDKPSSEPQKTPEQIEYEKLVRGEI